MRISDWSSDVCSSDLTAISWSSAARVRYCSTSTPAVRTSAVNAPPRVPTAGVPATRTTSKDQTPMTTAVRRKNVYRFKTRPYAHQKEALRQLISNGYGGALLMTPRTGDRQSGVEGKSGSVRLDLGGRRRIKKK